MEANLFDTTRKFVRVIEMKKNGMVEFEFAVGEPELYVELLLPAKAFEEFSAANRVVTLDATSPLQIAAQESEEDAQWGWSLHQARNSSSSEDFRKIVPATSLPKPADEDSTNSTASAGAVLRKSYK